MFEVGDLSKFISYAINDSFILAFKLTSPFLVVSLAILAGSGLLSRIMPDLQIFFVLTPVQIILVVATIYIVITSIVTKITETIQMSLNI